MSLLLGHEEFKRLKEYSESHRFILDNLRAIQRGQQSVPGDRKEYVLLMDSENLKYKVVFTIDETLTHKWVRHMSISVIDSNKLPADDIVREVCKHLGFIDFDSCIIRKEIFHSTAIEVLEYKNELKLVPFGPNLFLETDHNLLIKMHEGNAICVAYLNDDKALPLSSEKIELCKKLDICYVNV